MDESLFGDDDEDDYLEEDDYDEDAEDPAYCEVCRMVTFNTAVELLNYRSYNVQGGCHIRVHHDCG